LKFLHVELGLYPHLRIKYAFKRRQKGKRVMNETISVAGFNVRSPNC